MHQCHNLAESEYYISVVSTRGRRGGLLRSLCVQDLSRFHCCGCRPAELKQRIRRVCGTRQLLYDLGLLLATGLSHNATQRHSHNRITHWSGIRRKPADGEHVFSTTTLTYARLCFVHTVHRPAPHISVSLRLSLSLCVSFRFVGVDEMLKLLTLSRYPYPGCVVFRTWATRLLCPPQVQTPTPTTKKGQTYTQPFSQKRKDLST